MRISLRIIAGLAAIGLGIAILFMTEGLTVQIRIIAGAVVLLIACWGFQLVSEGTAALLFFLILAISQTVPLSAIFSGFTSPAFWLVFSGLIFGRALTQSGLNERLASCFQTRRPLSYPFFLGKILGSALFFAFFVPSAMGRVLILLPLLKSIAKTHGFSPAQNGYKAILLAGVLGTYLPAFAILPANLPNVIFAGAAKALYAQDIGYTEYFLLHFPVLGLFKLFLLWGYLCLLYPDTLKTSKETQNSTTWNFQEKLVLIILAGALVCWMLDNWHGLSPGWVGLATAILLLITLPQSLGKTLLTGIKIEPLLFVACAIGLGNILRASGLDTLLVTSILDFIPFDTQGGVKNSLTATGLFMSSGVMTSLPGIPSVFVPLAKNLAHAANSPLETMLALLVPAFSTVFFPYQAPPLVIAIHEGKVSHCTMLIACLTMSALTLGILLPVDFLWWKLLSIPLSTP